MQVEMAFYSGRLPNTLDEERLEPYLLEWEARIHERKIERDQYKGN
jgi:hypothetical protein